MLARELKYYPEEQLEISDERKKRIKRGKAIQKKNNSLVKLIFLCLPIMIATICIFILFRYVNITQVRQEITSLEYEKTELEKNKINLAGDLESLKSSPKIAEQAKYNLGMDYPTTDQVVYVTINDSSTDSKDKKSKNPLDLILAKIGNLF